MILSISFEILLKANNPDKTVDKTAIICLVQYMFMSKSLVLLVLPILWLSISNLRLATLFE